MHNDGDGHVPWYQGIEFFVSLRRLGKPSWFLNYNDGSVSGPYTLKSSTQLPYVLFIYLNPSRHGRGHTLMIPIDAVEKNDWRKLRAELRHPDSWEQ